MVIILLQGSVCCLSLVIASGYPTPGKDFGILVLQLTRKTVLLGIYQSIVNLAD
jgi:hypothetical protein